MRVYAGLEPADDLDGHGKGGALPPGGSPRRRSWCGGQQNCFANDQVVVYCPERDERDSLRAADVTEPVALLVALQLADEFSAAGSQAGNDGVDVLDGEFDVTRKQKM